MNKESLNKLKNESIYILALFVLGLIIFKLIFYKEQFTIVLKVVAGLFWLFVLPGFSLMYYWSDKLGFLERFLIGTAVSLALIGILSYHIGLAGLHVKYHSIVLPIVFLILGSIVIWRKSVST